MPGSHRNTCGITRYVESSRLKEAFGALLKISGEMLGAMFGIAMEVSRAAPEIAEGALDTVLGTVGLVLESMLVAIREVLKVVFELVESVLHETDARNKGRRNCELPASVVVEVIATPIVVLAVETDAFRKMSVAKGAGE